MKCTCNLWCRISICTKKITVDGRPFLLHNVLPNWKPQVIFYIPMFDHRILYFKNILTELRELTKVVHIIVFLFIICPFHPLFHHQLIFEDDSTYFELNEFTNNLTGKFLFQLFLTLLQNCHDPNFGHDDTCSFPTGQVSQTH